MPTSDTTEIRIFPSSFKNLYIYISTSIFDYDDYLVGISKICELAFIYVAMKGQISISLWDKANMQDPQLHICWVPMY